MIRIVKQGKNLLKKELTIEADDELLARLQKLIRRRNEAVISEEEQENWKLYDAALAMAVKAGMKTWPQEDLAMPENLLNTEAEDQIADRLLAGRKFDKPEDFSYYINAETLREMMTQ